MLSQFSLPLLLAIEGARKMDLFLAVLKGRYFRFRTAVTDEIDLVQDDFTCSFMAPLAPMQPILLTENPASTYMISNLPDYRQRRLRLG